MEFAVLRKFALRYAGRAYARFVRRQTDLRKKYDSIKHDLDYCQEQVIRGLLYQPQTEERADCLRDAIARFTVISSNFYEMAEMSNRNEANRIYHRFASDHVIPFRKGINEDTYLVMRVSPTAEQTIAGNFSRFKAAVKLYFEDLYGVSLSYS